MSYPQALTLDKFITYLGSMNGKDKVVKVLQYGAKLVAWYVTTLNVALLLALTKSEGGYNLRRR